MSGPLIKADVSYPRHPDLLQRDHNTALREANGEAARLHHEKHIPLHFTHEAMQRYGYKPRSARYQKLKDRLRLPPLISPRRGRSGTSKRVLTTQRVITQTAKQARLVLRFPIEGGTGRLRLKKGQTQLTTSQMTIRQLVDEIETIAPVEQEQIRAWIEELYLANCTPFVEARAAAKAARAARPRAGGRFVKTIVSGN